MSTVQVTGPQRKRAADRTGSTVANSASAERERFTAAPLD